MQNEHTGARRRTVVVLGAAGAMGRAAVRVVAAGDRHALVLADRDGTAAQALASTLPGAATAVAVDAADPVALRQLLAEADVVLNTTGPFLELGLPVLGAAIDTRTDYLDICDDPEPTVAMLELDAEARAAGVRAVVGVGASPGVLNLLAVRAAAELDEVDDLYTAWPVDVPFNGQDKLDDLPPVASREAASAAVVHWIAQLTGTIRLVRDGEQVDGRPLEPVELDVPGAGRGTAYTVGHPEPLTLAASLDIRRHAANLMVVTPPTVAFLDALRSDVDRGRLSPRDAAFQITNGATARRLAAGVRAFRYAGPGALPPFFAFAAGRRDGQPMTVGVTVASMPAGMDGATGIPLTLGLRQLDDGLIPLGVHPPERALDGPRLLAELAAHCSPAVTAGELLSVHTTTLAVPAS